MLLVLLVILVASILAVLVWALREQQRLRHLAFPRAFVKQIHKQLLEAEKEKSQLEEHNTDEYFEKLAWWEITLSEYNSLLEGNLAVYNGRKTIQEVKSQYYDLLSEEPRYVIKRIDKLKKIRDNTPEQNSQNHQ
jgi:hypothetical protein